MKQSKLSTYQGPDVLEAAGALADSSHEAGREGGDLGQQVINLLGLALSIVFSNNHASVRVSDNITQGILSETNSNLY